MGTSTRGYPSSSTGKKLEQSASKTPVASLAAALVGSRVVPGTGGEFALHAAEHLAELSLKSESIDEEEGVAE